MTLAKQKSLPLILVNAQSDAQRGNSCGARGHPGECREDVRSMAVGPSSPAAWQEVHQLIIYFYKEPRAV